MKNGRSIRAVRERLGESQAAFAARLGVNQGTISRWETEGLPTHGVAAQLVARVLAELDEDC